MALTHLDPEGRPCMVDVSAKLPTRRRAVAVGCLHLGPDCARALAEGGGPKGDPWSLLRLGAIQGVKRTSDLIPLAHPLAVDHVGVVHHWDPETARAWMENAPWISGFRGLTARQLT